MESDSRATQKLRPYNLPLGNAPARQVFFVVSETPCPYLPGLWERKLMTELGPNDPVGAYSNLSRAGFRRSHGFAFRPACADCNACVPVRIPAKDFQATRSQARTLKVNRDLVRKVGPAEATREHYALFRYYIDQRHGGGEMSTMNRSDFRSMIEESPITTQLVEYRDEVGLLVGAMLTDLVDDGFSAVYSYFHPELNRRSLGRFMVLDMVRRCHEEDKAFVYLGFWVSNAPKMAYKKDFSPLESLTEKGWQRL